MEGTTATALVKQNLQRARVVNLTRDISYSKMPASMVGSVKSPKILPATPGLKEGGPAGAEKSF